MKAVVYKGNGEIVFEERPMPVILEGKTYYEGIDLTGDSG